MPLVEDVKDARGATSAAVDKVTGEAYWKKTSGLMWTVLAIWFVAGFLVHGFEYQVAVREGDPGVQNRGQILAAYFYAGGGFPRGPAVLGQNQSDHLGLEVPLAIGQQGFAVGDQAKLVLAWDVLGQKHPDRGVHGQGSLDLHAQLVSLGAGAAHGNGVQE